jgi:hypothetical protein
MTMRRGGRLAVLAIAAVAAIGAARAADKEDGFFIFLDAAYASPQNTDEVLAVDQSFGATQTQSTIRTDFGSSFAGRLGFGYKWKGGQSLSIQYWKFDADERTQANGPAGGYMNFAIGPGSYSNYYGGIFGLYGDPGSLDITSKIKAETLDVVWGRDHDLTENLTLGWSLGLRYAKFDENETGTYYTYDAADTYYSYGVNKHNNGEMLGFQAAMRVTRNFGKRFAVTSGLGFSFLKGTVESTSGLTIPAGSFGAGEGGLFPTSASAKDSNRSGVIRDFDVGCYWRLASDHIHLGLGWEQSSWDGVPYDLVRNTVTSLVNVQARNNVTFSSWKVGFKYQF